MQASPVQSSPVQSPGFAGVHNVYLVEVIGMVRIMGMSAPSLPGESNDSLIPYKWLFLAFIKIV